MTNTLVAVDLEYTESVFTIPEIVEIGAVKITSDMTVLETFQAFVRPDNLASFTDYSEQLTGIKRSDIENARTWNEVWKSFAQFTEFTNCKLVAWHAYNDNYVLREAYRRNQIGYPHDPFIVDVAAMTYIIFSYLGVKTKFSLGEVCKRLQLVQPSHRALEDAKCVVRILNVLCNFEREFLGGTTSDLGGKYSPRSETDELLGAD